MLKLIDLYKTFETKEGEVKALNGIDLALPNKGMVFIIGSSGSGKSTLLNLIAGYDRPSKGEVIYDGKSISSLKDSRLAKYWSKELGFVFQDYALIESQSVKENILLGAKSTSRKIKKKVPLVLEEVALKGYEDRRAKTLSGGEKQRVSLARALIKNPSLILADEPCGNLDGYSSKLVLDILKKEAERSLVIIVSHNLEASYGYADRIIRLEKGEVEEDLSFDPSLFEEEGYLCLNDIDSFSSKEVEELSQNLASKETKGLRRRVDCFVKTKPNIEEETPKENQNKPGRGFVFPLFKELLRPKGKLFSFAIILSCLLTFFSLSYAITSFSGEERFKSGFHASSYTSLTYNKGIFDRGSIQTHVLYPFDEGDLDVIEDNGYEGEYYPVYKIYFSGVSSSRFIRDEVQITNSSLIDYYSREIGGVVVCPEEFIIQNLGLETLTIYPRSESEVAGVYITDYFADCLRHFQPSTYPNYDSILGMQGGINTSTHLYIKGIIKTDYERRLAPLKKAFDASGGDISVFLEEEYVKDYEFLLNCLNLAYATDPDFVSSYDYDPIVYKYRFDLKDENSILSLSSIQQGVTYSKALKDDEVMFAGSLLGIQEEEALTYEQMYASLNGFTLSGTGFGAENVASYAFPFQRSFSSVLLSENHPEYLSEDNCAEINGDLIYVSYDVYKDMFEENIYPYAYVFDDVEGAADLYDAFIGKNVYLDLVDAKSILDVEEAIALFGSTFRIFSAVSLSVSLLAIIFYGISIVKGKRYEIGVYKSLGYGKGELTLYYSCCLATFLLVTGVLYAGLYFLLLRFINEVLLESLTFVSPKVLYLGQYGLFDFNLPFVLLVLCSLLILLLLISLCYLFVLGAFKVRKILQGRE